MLALVRIRCVFLSGCILCAIFFHKVLHGVDLVAEGHAVVGIVLKQLLGQFLPILRGAGADKSLHAHGGGLFAHLASPFFLILGGDVHALGRRALALHDLQHIV